MNIAVIGGTGAAGSRIVEEALARGHRVTAISREPGRLRPQVNLHQAMADANDSAALSPVLAGNDAIVNALRFVDLDPKKLIDAVKQAGVKRYAVVGGAGSLYVAPGRQLVDAPNFPAEFRPESVKGRDFLNLLRKEDDLDWTYLSPSAEFAPGTRTGTFRLGSDELLVDTNGKSHISMEDFAKAMLDELEKPAHIKQRFTVGY
jgi:putative NADH-flavin reductase